MSRPTHTLKHEHRIIEQRSALLMVSAHVLSWANKSLLKLSTRCWTLCKFMLIGFITKKKNYTFSLPCRKAACKSKAGRWAS